MNRETQLDYMNCWVW